MSRGDFTGVFNSKLTKNEKSQPFASVAHRHALLGNCVFKTLWGSPAFRPLSNLWEVPKKNKDSSSRKLKPSVSRKHSEIWRQKIYWFASLGGVFSGKLFTQGWSNRALWWAIKDRKWVWADLVTNSPRKVNYLPNWSNLSKSNFHSVTLWTLFSAGFIFTHGIAEFC